MILKQKITLYQKFEEGHLIIMVHDTNLKPHIHLNSVLLFLILFHRLWFHIFDLYPSTAKVLCQRKLLQLL